MDHLSGGKIVWIDVIEMFFSPAIDVAISQVLEIVIDNFVYRSKKRLAAFVGEKPTCHFVWALYIGNDVATGT